MKMNLSNEGVDTTIYKTRKEQDDEAQRIIYRLSALERARKVALYTAHLIKLAKTKKAGKYIQPKKIQPKK
jgi:hypothetical protein